MQNRKGKYIVFEGIDGSGKSTQIQRVAKALRSPEWAWLRGQFGEVHVTCEPTDNPIGKLIREDINSPKLSREAYTALFVADTLEHFYGSGAVLERIARGDIVLSDRSYISTLAYQSQNVPVDWIYEAHRLSIDSNPPDAVFCFTLPVEVALERAAARGKLNHEETYERLVHVKNAYNQLARSRFFIPKHWHNIDADNSIDIITPTILRALYRDFHK